MASSAITVIVGFPHYWFGGVVPLVSSADPTRVIQGIVTGIGFLGAGVIMKEGLSISGLTTAASIWASSAIGILCGAGFYLAAISLTIVSSAIMIWGGYLENLLPSRHTLAVILTFKPEFQLNLIAMQALFGQLGFRLVESSLTIMRNSEHEEWHLVLIAINKQKVSIQTVANGLQSYPFLTTYQVAFARN
jgi:putative Mg2+ transporter-C (MgtC) family protein